MITFSSRRVDEVVPGAGPGLSGHRLNGTGEDAPRAGRAPGTEADSVFGWRAGAAGAAAPGLRALRDDVAAHARAFTALCEQAERLRERLGAVRFDLLVHGDRLTVTEHDAAARFDYAERVPATFERFRQGSCPPPRGISRPHPPRGASPTSNGRRTGRWSTASWTRNRPG